MLRERPESRRLFDMLRKGDTLVVRWIDRLGRNYQDVTDVIREFMRRGVVIETVINRMRFDGATKDPMQQAVRDALIGFMAAQAQAQGGGAGPGGGTSSWRTVASLTISALFSTGGSAAAVRQAARQRLA